MIVLDGHRQPHDCGPCPAVPPQGASHRLHAVHGSIARPVPAGCVVCGSPVPPARLRGAAGVVTRLCPGPRCMTRLPEGRAMCRYCASASPAAMLALGFDRSRAVEDAQRARAAATLAEEREARRHRGRRRAACRAGGDNALAANSGTPENRSVTTNSSGVPS